MNRKSFIKQLGVAGSGALALPGLFPHQKEKNKHSRRVWRIAHITDVHVQPEQNAPAGVVKCLQHIQNLEDPVDVIFNGGDSIMDALGQERSRVQIQWDLWNSILNDHNSLPVIHCIGNHDVWGAGSTDDIQYGKAWVLDEFGLETPYYSFDKNGWHFVVLDSTHPTPSGWYTAKLDEAQFNWLKEDLAKTSPETPVLVLSHIPIFAASPFLDGDNVRDGNWRVPGAWMHIDAREIIELFYEHKNVKVCLSGHIHLHDTVIYNDVTYHCNGAVSGNWWNDTPYHQTPAGYAIINLYDDGTHDKEYVYYGLYD